MNNHPFKTITLLMSNPNVTTCKLLKKTKWAGYNYELRYYNQLDKVELVIHKSHSFDEYKMKPKHVMYDHERIISKLKEDLIPDEHVLEFEKFLIQHAIGEVGCLNENV